MVKRISVEFAHYDDIKLNYNMTIVCSRYNVML